MAITRTSRLDGAGAAQPLDLALLQNAQDLGLQPKIHFRDFVEQQGAALRLFEFAGVRGERAGEGALLVAEQGGLEHVFRDRGAVDGDERRCRRAPNDRG